MKKFRSKTVSILTAMAFVLVSSPLLFAAENAQAGNLVGFVYGKDGKTPLEGAVVMLKNVKTSEVYKSEPTGKAGEFRVTNVPEGVYVVGISVGEEGYNSAGAVKVAAGKTETVSFSLKPMPATPPAGKKTKGKKGFFKSPVGIAVIVAGTAAIIYGIYKLTKEEEEEEVSPVIH